MIGILALQGCVEPHERQLARLGVAARRVRLAADLDGISGLILPGGESTTMLHLLKVFAMIEPLQERASKILYWGVCAGAILMARSLAETSVRGPGQFTLGIMDVTVERNAYGRQRESFTDEVELAGGRRQSATFIRAPRFVAWGAGVSVAGSNDGEAVFLEAGAHMITAFHPELSENLFFHERFARKCGEVVGDAPAARHSLRV